MTDGHNVQYIAGQYTAVLSQTGLVNVCNLCCVRPRTSYGVREHIQWEHIESDPFKHVSPLVEQVFIYPLFVGLYTLDMTVPKAKDFSIARQP